MLTGGHDRKTGMWKLPINLVSRNSTLLSLDLPLQGPGRQQHNTNNLYTLPFKQQQLKYMHQAFFNLQIQTLIPVANNGQMKGIPLLRDAKMKKSILHHHRRRPKAGLPNSESTPGLLDQKTVQNNKWRRKLGAVLLYLRTQAWM